MTDIKPTDVTGPEELAEKLDSFAFVYARRTGDYHTADLLKDSADWLRKLAEARAKYSELLHQVSEKHPGETRHDTAKRMLQQYVPSGGVEARGRR